MEKELSKMDIVLFALYKLGGVSNKIRTEEIAWEAYQLDKEKFSWCLPKFIKMGFPDKLTVLIALETAHKEKYGRLVVGRAGRDAGGKLDGWIFTPQGAKWIKENEKHILDRLVQEEAPVIPKRDAERFIKKFKTDPLFKFYQEKKDFSNTTQYMFTDMLVCAPDASKDIIKQKFEKLYSNAELVKDLEVIDFLNACKEKFRDITS